MKDAAKGQIRVTPQIGPERSEVHNGTPYPKESLSIVEAARRAGAGPVVPNADEIKLPYPNQD